MGTRINRDRVSVRRDLDHLTTKRHGYGRNWVSWSA